MSNGVGRVRVGGGVVDPSVFTWDKLINDTGLMTKMNEMVAKEIHGSFFRLQVTQCNQESTRRLGELQKNIQDLKFELFQREVSIPNCCFDKMEIKKLNFDYRMGAKERIFYGLLMQNDDLAKFLFNEISEKLRLILQNNTYQLLHESVRMLYDHRISYTQYCENYVEIQKVEYENEFLLAYQNDLNDQKTDVVLEESQVNEESDDTNSIDQVLGEVVTLSSISAKASNQNVTKAFFAIFIVLMAIFYNLA